MSKGECLCYTSEVLPLPTSDDLWLMATRSQMMRETFHSSLFWSKCSGKSPTTLLGCLYFYDFSTKCIAFFSWPGFRGHPLGYYIHKCSWQQATEDMGAKSFERSITYSSCWDFDLMNLFHFNKILRFLFLLNLFWWPKNMLRNWPSPCFEGERLLGVTLKRWPLLWDVSVVPGLLWALPLTWQRTSSMKGYF